MVSPGRCDVTKRDGIRTHSSREAPTPRPVAGARAGDAAILRLQTKIGNRATAQLLRQPRTDEQKGRVAGPGAKPRYEGEEVAKWEFKIASEFQAAHRVLPEAPGKPQKAFVGDTLEVRATFRSQPDHAHLLAGGDGDLKTDARKWESDSTYLETFRFDKEGAYELEAWVAGPTLKTYAAKHSFEVATHEHWRTSLERQVDNMYASIRELQVERIDAWKQNAADPESTIGLDVLMVAIAIVSEGIGGIAFGVIENLLAKTTISSKALKEFAELAGLEAGDLAAEKAFHAGIDLAKTDLEKGIASAADKKQIEQDAGAALATKTNALDQFVEGMRLHTESVKTASQSAFDGSSAFRSDEDVLHEEAALKQFHYELGRHPKKYEQELTIGMIRLLDEAQLAEAAEDKGRNPKNTEDRRKTFEEDRDLHETWFRAGSLVVSPEHSGRDGIGKWSHPDLSFTGFEVEGGGFGKKALDPLEGATIEDLPVTMAFSFSAHDPFDYLLEKGDLTSLSFVRSADGDFYVPDSSSDSPGEWLASYYTGSTERHTNSEREFFAPMGAKKLYEAIKTKKVTDVTWRKL